jgi:hypothetical protein
MKTIETILEALAKITPEQIAQAALSFTAVEEGEHVFGVVQSEFAKSLWALAHRYEAETQMYTHSFKFDAINDDERRAFMRLIGISHALEEIARDLAWAEIRDEFDAWASDRVGLRNNFTLVSTQAPPPTMQGLAIPLAALASLREMLSKLGGDASDDDDPPKRKPQ